MSAVSEPWRRGGRRCALLAFASLTCAGCSLGTFGEDACETDADCVQSFGIGATCGGDGLCSEAVIHPRCTETFPADLFGNPARADDVVIATMFRRSVERENARNRAVLLAASQAADEDTEAAPNIALVMCDHSAGAVDDDLSDLQAALEVADYLRDTLRVPAIVGPAGSETTIEVFQRVREQGTLVISPSATSPSLATVDVQRPTDAEPGLLWRTAPADSAQGSLIAADMSARGTTKVAIVSQAGAYGDGLAEVFSAAFAAAGGTSQLLSYASETAFSENVQQASTLDVEAVLFISSDSADVKNFLNTAANNANFADKEIFLTDSAASQDVLDGSDPTIFPRVRGTRPKPLTVDDFAYGNFSTAYRARYQQNAEDFSFTAQSYDAGWLTFYGAAWADSNAGGVSGQGIARGLRQVSTPGGREYQVVGSRWPEIVETFRQGIGIDVTGASSPLDYDPATEEFREGSAPLEVWVIQTEGDTSSIVPAPAS